MSASQTGVIPSGATLVHIGPFKTGTTAVQGAFHSARDRLTEHGVVYAGEQRQAMRAVMAVSGRRPPEGWSPPTMAEWEALVADVAAAPRRAVVSSEFFSDCDEATAQRVVDELGGSDVHVVVTLRPLADILPSQWQHYIQSGLQMPYDQWLQAMFDKPLYGPPCASFWWRHRHDQLVERWSELVGPQNTIVVVVDPTDRSMVLRTFEDLVGLPDGFLVPEPGGDPNRSLTFGEAELVRRMNIELRRLRRHSVVPAFGSRAVVRGMYRRMRVHSPQPNDRRIHTPAWALERSREVGAEMARHIADLDVHVVGDLDSLATAPEPAPVDRVENDASPAISTELATAGVLGTVLAQLGRMPQEYASPTGSTGSGGVGGVGADATDRSGRSGRSRDSSRSSHPDSIEHLRVGEVPAKDLALILARRICRRARRVLGRRSSR